VIIIPGLLVANADDKFVDERVSKAISDCAGNVVVSVIMKQLTNSSPGSQDVGADATFDGTDWDFENDIVDIVLDDVIVFRAIADSARLTGTNDGRVEVKKIEGATKIDEEGLLARTGENANGFRGVATGQEVVGRVDELVGIGGIVVWLAEGLVTDVGKRNSKSIVVVRAMSDDGGSAKIVGAGRGGDVLVVVEVIALDGVDEIDVDGTSLSVVKWQEDLERNLNTLDVASRANIERHGRSGVSWLTKTTLRVIVVIGIVDSRAIAVIAASKIKLEDMSRVDGLGIADQMELEEMLVREGVPVRSSVGVLKTRDSESENQIVSVGRGLEHVEIGDIRRRFLGSARSLRMRGGRCLKHQTQKNGNQKKRFHFVC
jgi:hypothetical protein